MSEPLISIVTATYKRPELLQKAIKSALAQSYKNLEIVVTDDGDDESTSEICKSFNDVRIKFVKNSAHKKSPNGNKNNGFDNATGEFVCLLDDDDELLPETIAMCYEILKSGEYSCVFADAICEKDGVMTEVVAGRSPYSKSGAMSKVDYHCGRINGEYFKLFSREFIDDFRFDESSFGGENELYIRFFEKNVFYSAEEIKEFIIRNRIALEDKTEKAVRVLDIERRDFTTIYSTLEDEWEELGDKEKNKINQYLEKINDILLKKEEDNNIQEAEVVK